jgi:hypothetical protein
MTTPISVARQWLLGVMPVVSKSMTAIRSKPVSTPLTID